MRIINKHEVVMTNEEQVAHDAFDGLLDEGYNVPESVKLVRDAHPNLDPNFYRWIGDEPIIVGLPIRVVIGYDSQDHSYIPTATAFDEKNDVVEILVEVRDYGRGDETDEDGNLFLRVDP